MKYLALILTTLFAFFTYTQATITHLTDENFADLIGKDDEWLIDL
jgi:hypothetical protein